jgi:hypothetical protein
MIRNLGRHAEMLSSCMSSMSRLSDNSAGCRLDPSHLHLSEPALSENEIDLHIFK